MNKRTFFNITPFQDLYCREVIDFIVRIQKIEFGIPITGSDQPDLANIPRYYQVKTGNFWIAEYKNKIIGTIALLDIGNGMAALRKMFVHRLYRGGKAGVAKALLRTLIQWARTKQIKEIYLGTTPKFLAAHRFYEKNNFIEIGREDLPETFPVMKVDTKFYQFDV